MSESRRHTQGEVEARINKCYELRFEQSPGITHTRWQEYCAENYGDRSQQQYTEYWMKSSERYKEARKEKLDTLLDPAVNKLFELLASDNEQISSKAVDQIMKYTNNAVEKLEVDANISFFKASFTDEGDDSTAI